MPDTDPADVQDERYTYEDYLQKFSPTRQAETDPLRSADEEAELLAKETLAIFEKALQR